MVRLALALLLVSTPALADDGYVLSYRGVESCPSEAEVKTEVERRVRDASRANGATLELEVSGDADGFVGRLLFVDRDGERGTRTIRGRSCTEVSNALVFFAGLAIELGALESDEPKPPPPPPKPKEKPAPPPKKPPPPPPSPLERDPSARSLIVAAGARGGLAPRPRPYASLAFELASRKDTGLAPALRFGLVASWSRLESGDDHASLLLVGGRVDGCPIAFGGERLAFAPCVAFEAAPVFASGEIEVDPKRATEPWLAAEAFARVRFRLSERFFTELEGAVVLPLRRSRYYFEPDRTLYRVPAVTGRGSLALGVTF